MRVAGRRNRAAFSSCWTDTLAKWSFHGGACGSLLTPHLGSITSDTGFWSCLRAIHFKNQVRNKTEKNEEGTILNHFLLSYLMFSEAGNWSHISLYVHWEATFLRLIYRST